MTNSDMKMGRVSFVLSIVACLLGGAALFIGLSAGSKASRSVAETRRVNPPFDTRFELRDGQRIDHLGLHLRLIQVERADPDGGWDDFAVLALEAEGIAQQVAIHEARAIEFGPFEIRAERVIPDPGADAPAGRGNVRFRIRYHASLAARGGRPGQAAVAEATRRLSRGDEFEFNGLRLRLVRVEENDPMDRDDDSAELSLVTGTQASELLLRELDTLFFENYELTAERVNPSASPPDAWGRAQHGAGTAQITVRQFGPPERPPQRRPIG